MVIMYLVFSNLRYKDSQYYGTRPCPTRKIERRDKQMNDDSQEDLSTFVYHPGRAKSALPLSGGSLAVDRHATSAGLSCVNNKSLLETVFCIRGWDETGVPSNTLANSIRGFPSFRCISISTLVLRCRCSLSAALPPSLLPVSSA